MSNEDIQSEEGNTDQVERNPVRAQLRNLEAKNKELEAKLSKATEAERKLAFVEAGVDLNTPLSRYFVKAYDGEMTSEAIRQAATEANLIGVRNPEAQAEQNAWNRVQKAATANENSDGPVDWITKISNAKTQDEVLQIVTQAKQAQQNI